MRRCAVLIVVLVVMLIAGCQEERKSPLPQPRENWRQRYGEGAESRQDYCTMALIKNVIRQSKEISDLNARLEKIEKPETEKKGNDPNE